MTGDAAPLVPPAPGDGQPLSRPDEVSEQVVQRYLDELAGELPADWKESSGLLDELRDHLLCDLEDTPDSGRDGPGIGSVLARLGDARALGASLRRQVESAAVRRASDTLLRLVVVVGAVWALVLLAGPHEPWAKAAEPAGICGLEHLCSAGAVITLSAAVLARISAAVCDPSPGGSRCATHRVALASTALTLAAAVGTASALLAYFVDRSRAAPASLSATALALAAACSVAAAVRAVPVLERSVRSARPTRRHRGRL